ncbi:DegT/DnrJ/EryC1/StrS family aminotransferase [Trinickia dinghuensis]|uniref:DegT/DnrJ/EryC1/StrS family aminotransferase n=1 Tax=Trinickia dinghuensis TaxID=2291023 RepID=A0A3D8JZS7_9BURK|nr:DegT/DnrJ/EryC1/StrS family aminotransferase [Trinickia dinghuensis]RDU98390.1 DegT/DnrJ/EryC1/StrS family aminotransferase [Trinickia dinghuensis]
MTLHVGQFNLPSRDRYEAAMRGIFERRYYTNQGPLARAFEDRLQAFLQVKHAVCVTNATIGLMMASEALGISGRVIVPAVCNATLAQALWWCRVQAIFADVDTLDGQLDVDALAGDIAERGPVNAVIGANLWGNACDASALVALARKYDLPVMFDSSHAFGCEVAQRSIGSFGDAEVFSFDAADIVNAGGAACVTTDDDELAARLRNIRSSYGAGRPVAVVKTSNGRMSEAQAALGLLSLDDYEANRAHNRALVDAYRTGLGAIMGVRVVEARRVDASNHQALVCVVDENVVGVSRDALGAHLAEHGVEAVAVRALDSNERIGAQIDRSWLRLPLGAHVGEDDVERVCDLIGEVAARRGSSRSLV